VDAYCRRLIDANPNLLVPWYLMASYLYYHEDESLLSDPLYDEICARLKANWKTIKHRHKRLIDFKSLGAGTGYTLPRHKYPTIVRSAAWRLLDNPPE
jgi:hypothetical protein